MDNRPEDRNHESRSPLTDLYRLGTTYRWQVVHLSKQQTVAEHSYFVALLFMKFAQVCELEYWEALLGLEYALLHDADEAWSGDIPGPLKKFMATDLPIDKMMGEWEGRASKKGMPPLILHLVKLADIVEACKYLTKFGNNNHSQFVRNKYVDMIDEKFREIPRALVVHYDMDEDDLRPLKTCDELKAAIGEFVHGKETYIDDYM